MGTEAKLKLRIITAFYFFENWVAVTPTNSRANPAGIMAIQILGSPYLTKSIKPKIRPTTVMTNPIQIKITPNLCICRPVTLPGQQQSANQLIWFSFYTSTAAKKHCMACRRPELYQQKPCCQAQNRQIKGSDAVSTD